MWTSKKYGENTKMTTFATLKQSSDQIARLNKELEKLKTPTYEKKSDERFWKPEVDKAGNGSAIIRFLPAAPADGDDALPWVRIFSHSFKGPTGKWYIENSLTTPTPEFPNGRPDPLSEYNTELWNEVDDDNSPQRKQARMQKRKLSYYSNIYVVSDPKHPENEGKVFLYRYGKKNFDKILLAMNPEFEGDAEINPFDLWKGANFRLRIRNVEGYPNYDQSSFSTPSKLVEDDAELEKIWKSQYSLKSLISPDKFKSREELIAKLNSVLGVNVIKTNTAPQERKFASSGPTAKSDKVTQQVVDELEVDDEDDDLAKFKALAD